MKKLIKFELLKARYNMLYLAVLIIMSLILFLAMVFSISTYHETYIFKQHDRVQMMLDTDNSLSEAVKSYYQEILNTDSWQEIYQIYNKIDDLNEGAKTDLEYDGATNIEYRNYQLKHQIPPESNTSGIWMINLVNNFLKYIIVGIFIIMGLNILFIEYQEHTDNYLFCLSYRYREILFAKLLVILLISIITVILPLLIFYFLSSIIMGFTNPHTIFMANNLLLADVIINNDPFITINHLLCLSFVGLVFAGLMITVIIFIFVYVIKINPPILIK